MLYPRITEAGVLVNEEQLVGTKEHLAIQKRMIFLTGAMGGDVESHNVLYALDSLGHEPIKIVVTCGGGEIDAAFLLYDSIRLLKSPVYTFGKFCVSAAVLILAVGKKRYLSPHAKVMLHLPSGQAAGDARDWEIQHEEMKKYKAEMVNLLIECGAKKSYTEILKDMDRDFWLEPKEAIAYGLADEIMTPKVMAGWLR